MKKKILLTDNIMEAFVHIYKKKFSVDTLWNTKNIKYSKYEGVVASGLFNIPSSFYNKLSSLKIISMFGVGFDNINLKICKERNIKVANTPGVLTTDVADLALTLLLSISRNLFISQQYVLSNDWIKKGPMKLTDSVYNKKVGIVGLGNIGKEFAKKAEVFSMNINYFGPRKKNVKYTYFNSLKKMAKNMDYLVITCAGGDQTKKMINKEILNSMKKTAYIINVSRGSVIDEKALLNSLKNKTIKGAALDVYENEPKINPLFKKLNNIILHPHHGSGTFETRKLMAELSSANLINFFKTGKPLHKVI
jgi:lactate dehydrogenase-like 2-hydroxyacid dehydrogenase